MKGQIIKALSGFYYVEANQKVYQTRGRGNFRASNQKPLVGDFVEFESTNDKEGVLLKLFPRKNELVRPPICNVDKGIIVMSAIEPDFSSFLLDRFIVTLEQLMIQPVIYVSKCDLIEDRTSIHQMCQYYEQLGYTVFYSHQENVLSTLKNVLQGKLSVLMGQSGAGKSTLLNELLPELDLKTGDISTHLGRGRHTTRHVEVHDVEGCFIADTPGFSAIDFFDMSLQELEQCFVDFFTFKQDCQFRGCLHTHEPHCAVKKQLDTNVGLNQRYQHYVQFHDEIKNKKIIYKK
ncbi:ribosome small subunit-dependent GTPase A [Carnobacteriaceae bacterium zg-84]|uniref:ribosome small subunit-dependent GTPase A n=1 Tax=Granulicatella sp. zg-84 TaxID=2678503 RepID=UPI0013C1363C|nr:ribosome small subunit-dependent GTPase A [Granulicatella sp. zg-84]QMI86670.1 ribosome small subunit-dependent GTPase A [Carnobacteriaceae bacterium zg-84]